jgi:epoxyqueuosine reductase
LLARPGAAQPDLLAWLDADPEAFRRSIRGTALTRARRGGLVRNAALVLGSRRVAEAVPALIRRLDDPDPDIRAAAAWALRRIADESLPVARDDGGPAVRDAARQALERLDRSGATSQPALTSPASASAWPPDRGGP